MSAKVSLQKDKIKFLLLEGVHQSTVDALKAAGYNNIEYHKKALDDADLIASLKDAHFVGIRSRTHLTREVLQQAPKLCAIGCFCIGTNQVDLQAAAELGIPVFNAPFSNTRSVAEMVLGQMILLMRNIPKANMEVHRGVWNKSASNSNEIRNKTLGIIGYGHIGSQLSIIAESLGMRVFFYDIENKLPLGNAQQVTKLEDLLAMSDVVSLHVPETPATKNIINAETLKFMKDDAVLINAARGTVVDVDALVEVLRAGKLRGVAADVFPEEPASAQDPFMSPLTEFDHVMLTPHIGGSTAEAQENIGSEVAAKLIKYSDNGSTITSVNFPEVSLPSHGQAIRLLHIHANQPGMLNQINQIFMAHQINIAGQFLSTHGDLGYVVIDVDAEASQVKPLVEALRVIPGTIKVRSLF